MKKLFSILCLLTLVAQAYAQFDDNQYNNQIDPNGNISKRGQISPDSLGSDKEIPKGIKVWTIDSRFGDRTDAQPDTLSHMFMNSIFTTGVRGEYNALGNLGSPRISRIFIDRPDADEQFIFTLPYDFFVKDPSQFHFTNTLSPFTNLTFNSCGDRVNGEDHFTAKFGVNAGKRLGFGFNFDYIYGRGYYNSQATSHFNYTLYGSYLGDRYQAHLLFTTNHQKVTENGGITDDNYIVHPESFSDSYTTSEIPTVLEQNWNRNDNQHILFTHRYNLGFNRKVPMTEDEIKAKKFAIEAKKEEEAKKAKEKAEKEGRKVDDKTVLTGRPDDAIIAGNEPTQKNNKGERIAVNGKAAADSLIAAEKKAKEDTAWVKNEYVPVTSFIHTVNFSNYRRIYEAYKTPADFYAQTYNVNQVLTGDSIYDQTKHYSLKNTFALSLLEGFNKWAKAGLKAFVTHQIEHFELPDSVGGTDSETDHNISIGAQLSKTQGNTLHYNVIGETWVVGDEAGQIKVDANVDLNFPLFGDTITLAASGFFHHIKPTHYYRHYHSKHLWWDNDDLSKITHTRIQGIFAYKKTRTTLRVAVDEISNYTYFVSGYNATTAGRTGYSVNVEQNATDINLLTAQLSQDFTFGPLNWENVITYQRSSNNNVLPVPDLNAYSNLYLRFKIAKVLKCDFGADVRYFTKYYAPDYSPMLGQYTVQKNMAAEGQPDTRIEIGNYPIVNVYANFHLKHTRFFIMMSHINAGSGKRNYFLVPHYALNDRILRIGLSWNFYN